MGDGLREMCKEGTKTAIIIDHLVLEKLLLLTALASYQRL